MTNLNLHFRQAAPEDADHLAQLVNMAGDGLPLYLWGKMAQPGQDAWSVGRERAQRDHGGFSYRNATLAILEENIAGCLIGYPLDTTPEKIDPASIPEMFLPLVELEALAAGTWYINVLAVFPEFRGLSIGSRLLELAECKPATTDRAGLSLIVSDANHGAMRLYERSGYRERASRPMLKEGWKNPGKNWNLMVKT